MEVKKLLKLIGIILIVLIFAYGMVWIKVLVRANDQFSKAEKNFANKDYYQAGINYSEVIRNYSPGNKLVYKSAEKLWEIAQIYEKEKRYRLALEIYRDLASSFYAVRSFYTPGKDWIKKSEDRIKVMIELIEKEGK